MTFGRSTTAEALLRLISQHRVELLAILHRYGASNPRVFGSVARGDATFTSDVDLLVDLEPGGGNALLRVAGIGEELSQLLGIKVDVVADELLREPVAASAHSVFVAI